MTEYKYIFATLFLAASLFGAAAQRPLSVTEEGRDALRGRLIPYPTAAEAAAASLARQRYMQPVEQWRESAGEAGARTFEAEFTVPFSWVERQTFLRIEGAGAPYEVIVNGRFAGYAQNGFAPSEFNVTKLSREDKNKIEIRFADTAPLAAVECFGARTPRLRAMVISQPRIRVRDVLVRTRTGIGTTANVDVGIVVHNQTLNPKRARIYYDLYTPDSVSVAAGYKDVELGMYGVDTVRLAANIDASTLWSDERPTMYRLEIRNRIAGRDAEFFTLPVGFRSEEYSGGEFRINEIGRASCRERV